MKSKLLYTLLVTLIIAGCSSEPEYTGRITKPFSKDYLKGKPKKMTLNNYYSKEDYDKKRPAITQIVDIDENGYVTRMETTTRENRQVTEYQYSSDFPGKYKSIKSTTTFLIHPGQEVTLSTFYLDNKGNYTKFVTTSDSEPTFEGIYDINEQGYPVAYYYYSTSKSKEDFEKKLTYKYSDGRCIQVKGYIYGASTPAYEDDVTDDGTYEDYITNQSISYNSKGEIINYSRWSYDNQGHELLKENSDDGKNWNLSSDKTYNELGDIVKEVNYYTNPPKVQEYKYTYDDHGNWTKQTKGDMISTRKIEYYN